MTCDRCTGTHTDAAQCPLFTENDKLLEMISQARVSSGMKGNTPMTETENSAFAFKSAGCRIFLNECLCTIKHFLQQYPAVQVAESIVKSFTDEEITAAKNLLFCTLYLSVPINESCTINHEVATVASEFGKYTERRGQNKAKTEIDDIIKYCQRADAIGLATPIFTTPRLPMAISLDSWSSPPETKTVDRLVTDVSELKKLVSDLTNEIRNSKMSYAKIVNPSEVSSMHGRPQIAAAGSQNQRSFLSIPKKNQFGGSNTSLNSIGSRGSKRNKPGDEQSVDNWEPPKPRRSKQIAKQGTNGDSNLVKATPKPPARIHLFVGRLSNDSTPELLNQYCTSKGVTPVHVRCIEREESRHKQYHCIFKIDDAETVNDTNFWPKGTNYRRYWLSREDWLWLKDIK